MFALCITTLATCRLLDYTKTLDLIEAFDECPLTPLKSRYRRHHQMIIIITTATARLEIRQICVIEQAA